MHKMEELREMLCEELETITKKGELSAGSLDAIDKLTHSIKSIDTIMAMEGYSGDDYSYARGRNAKRDSMGRYSREYRPRHDYSYGRYSGDAMETLKHHLDELEDEVSDEKSRKMIKEWKKDLV